MRMTTRTSLAMKTLMFCAVNGDRIVRRAEIAATYEASENHLAQVIHLLAQKKFLRTIRGRAGGLTLGRPADKITVGEVFRSFERVLPFAECFSPDHNSCPLSGNCRLTCLLDEALEAFYDRLDHMTIADLVGGNAEVERILQIA
jgi:Rrf2 family nitric oxide-sensitive transcriptional repressor